MKGKAMQIALSAIGILVVLFLARVIIQGNQVPELGVQNGKLAAISNKPNNVSSQTDDPAKKVATLPFKASQTATLSALKAAVASYGGGKIVTESDDYLYVVFTTSLMRYRDDVEFWLDAKNQQVHYRSASRAGYSDLGLNRERYNKLAELYRQLP
ncbi:MAG: DUF1499 domain-containing protein [Zhongshania sp.]|uniref:DUF1499 domain-containing protein n=1 Tax=Zhongshania sp. TaxID=1971902 RepID=UPI0026340A11|nr:DUF1499 domain-containing protein [Zhongshania sp.]MDF1694090.1 DUF1499 domain-containing protein [Zhongshania sp.]